MHVSTALDTEPCVQVGPALVRCTLLPHDGRSN